MSNPSFDQAYQMLNLAREAGASLEDLQTLYATGLLSDLLKTENPATVDREKFRTLLGFDPSVFRVKMGGPENTDQIMAALGFPFNEWINQKNFPLKQAETPWEDGIEIVDPDRSFSFDECPVILSVAGLLAPIYEHGIRFAQQHGKTTTSTKKPFVVFPHEPWQDPDRDRRVMCFGRHPSDRRLHLYYPGYGFYDDCVLAGVRPRKQPSVA